MKEVTLNNKNYFLVEVPLNSIKYKVSGLGFICYKTSKYSQWNILGQPNDDKFNSNTKIIGRVSEILKDEDICKGLVNKAEQCGAYNYYYDYVNNYSEYYKATDSFLSYLQSIDLDLTKYWLLIQKL